MIDAMTTEKEAYDRGRSDGRLDALETRADAAAEGINGLWKAVSEIKVSLAKLWVWVTVGAAAASFAANTLSEWIWRSGGHP